ncbi:hypothetical protein Patl1_34528 [Pistacia atlantica]|uniref:Uncharacterized protein n=1 Tax=Pistacia atlantica TaxID=434234 RepID=A0ACC0ZQI9_9ROSI|nr:hypothetical protein Patl1_34528 [Pistacia atlantica]
MVVIFSKELTGTDVNNRLAIPTECLEQFGKIPEEHHSLNFDALWTWEGHEWPFCLSTRRKDPYSKPVLNGKGWLAFVEDRHLKEGDTITFSKETDEANGVTFRIKAQKTIRLWGENITKDV